MATANPATTKMPTLYIPHGAGPCFFMDWTMGPRDTWDKLAGWLRGIDGSLPESPRALVVVSAHWETPVPTVIASARPPLLFDYFGFPKRTYELEWAAPGSPGLADRIRSLLSSAKIESQSDTQRGFDHGVFVPMKVAYPDAKIPTVQLSLRADLDPNAHVAIGRALEPLRDEGVLIVGSGMSFHNMGAFRSGGGGVAAAAFDGWLSSIVEKDAETRAAELGAWAKAPSARESHPREEHLLPLMVAAGAGGKDAGKVAFRDVAMGVTLSAIRFG
jgi:aromatic ring-opening dioxygenase catalytic subunit (LigB family)